MIQRKQSLFLLISAILSMVIYFFPIANFNVESGVFELFSCHVVKPENITANVPVIAISLLPLLTGLLSLIAIFLFKNRKLQLKLGKVSFWILILYVGIAGYFVFSLSKTLDASPEFNLALPLAFLALIFNLLAQRGIKKDEALVRAADRIR